MHTNLRQKVELCEHFKIMAVGTDFRPSWGGGGIIDTESLNSRLHQINRDTQKLALVSLGLTCLRSLHRIYLPRYPESVIGITGVTWLALRRLLFCPFLCVGNTQDPGVPKHSPPHPLPPLTYI